MSLRKLNVLVCWIPAAALAIAGIHRPALAQCPSDWIKTDGFPGVGGIPNVSAVTTWDPDGAGPSGIASLRRRLRYVAANLMMGTAKRKTDDMAA